MEGNDDAAENLQKKRKKKKKKKHTSPSIGKHIRINEMFKKKKADDEVKVIEEEEAATKAREDEDAKDNDDADATTNENIDEDAVKAKVDEIAIRRAKLLAKLKAINKETAELEKEKKTKNKESLHHHSKIMKTMLKRIQKKDANESPDAATKAKGNEEASTKKSNFVVRLKSYRKNLIEVEKKLKKPKLEEEKKRKQEDEKRKEEALQEMLRKKDAEKQEKDNKKRKMEEESPKIIHKRRSKKQAEIDKLNKESKAKDDEDVMSTSNEDEKEEIRDEEKKGKKLNEASNNEELLVEKTKKTNKTQSSTLREYLKKQSNNESGEEEQDESDEKEDIKKLKKEMGFERFIHFLIVLLPSTLAYQVIENFYAPSMELRLQNGSIKARRQKVHDMIDIPMGSRKLEDLKKRTSKDTFITKWEEQFRHLKKLTSLAIATQISSTEDADFMFKMNFITLFGSTMGTLENVGRVPTKLIKSITEDVDISDIDWCRYILDCLKTSKNNWNDVKTRSNYYYRPLTFLSHGLDFYKGLDVYIVPLSERNPVTKERFRLISKKRVEMVEILKEGISKFKGDNLMSDLCKQYKKVFKSTKDFHLDESFMDEDNSSDGDTDNDNNNSDEDDPQWQMKTRKIKMKMQMKSKMKEKENDEEKVSENDGNENDDDIVDSIEVDDLNEQMKEKKADKKRRVKRMGMNKKLKMKKRNNMKLIRILVFHGRRRTRLRFETKDGAATIREYMQTLAPQLKVESNVTDTFSLVLNHEQKMNSTGKKTKDMFKWKKENGKYDEEKQFEAFAKTIESEPKWGTKENDTDYGIFLMMHIENYTEETAKNWNLGFKKENEGNTLDIIKMRMRFATKMLSHEINIHRVRISEEAQEFTRRYSDKKSRGTWYTGEPLWGCSELGGYLVVEGLIRITPLSHATYLERKCFPTGILVYT
nr:hypothetical protein [Tanacetum cinerariifolium]